MDGSRKPEKVCRVVHQVSYMKGPEDLWRQIELEDHPLILPRYSNPHHCFSLQAGPSPQCHLRAEEHRGSWGDGKSRKRRAYYPLEPDQQSIWGNGFSHQFQAR
jgi:hypothetical protein